MRKKLSLTPQIVLACVAMALCIACHNGRLSREERRVRKAAERCYASLAKGQADKFVKRIAYVDSMSEGYRQEMTDLVSEHVHNLTQHHGELQSVKAVGQVVEDGQAHVYLQLSFADSTCEEVGVPMVKVGDTWLMQ